MYGESVGNFPAEVCDICKEIFFDEETSQKITATTKAKGLWGLGAQTKVEQAGSTLDIRLPKKIISFLNLRKREEVTFYPENKRKLIIER